MLLLRELGTKNSPTLSQPHIQQNPDECEESTLLISQTQGAGDTLLAKVAGCKATAKKKHTGKRHARFFASNGLRPLPTH
ncbi:MAG: hypothetical protein CL920_22090 [Deltaproteobacteria bacterium]|nr:hypothetical protein [Deltaproteobacteria bacterium]MBU51389.1 hypothetical protein [Deltaproteobacteria bacterium]